MAYNTSFTDLDQLDLNDKEWEACTFSNCSFSSLSHHVFIDCVFEQCNLSNTHVANTAFRNCTFKDCKLIGVNFSSSREFGFEIHVTNCNLDYTAFDGKKFYQSTFNNSSFKGANFSEADLSKCKIENCDFSEAVFSDTNLAGLNFTSNQNFQIDPTLNRVSKTRFSRFALSGLLYNTGIIIE
jgi:uncharacterized protein YjbI with pentapeptide repeats